MPEIDYSKYTPFNYREGLYLDSSFVVSVKSYGAIGDGVTDDTAAFNKAIAFALEKNPTPVDANNVIGATIFVPDGRYKITASLTAINRSGVHIVGASENGTVLLFSHNGPVFTFGTVAQIVVGGGISNLKIEYLSAPLFNSCVVAAENATRLQFANILMANVGRLATLGTSSTMFASAITFSGIKGYCYNGGQPLISANYGAGLFIENSKIFVGGVTTPTSDRVSTMTTVAGTNLINLGVGSWDTVQITAGFFERFYRGIEVITNTGIIVNNVFVSNTYFDYIRQDAVWIQSISTVSGGIFGFNFDNVWLSSWEGDGISLNGPGLVRGITVANCRLPHAGTHSIKMNNGVSEVNISNCYLTGSNRTNVNAMGIAVFGGNQISIVDNVVGYDSTWSGMPWQPLYGISVVPDISNILVRGNDSAGSSLAYNLETNTVGSKDRIAYGNRKANYAGNQAISVPASTVLTVNKSATTWLLHVHGGTVTAIAKNGTTITGMTSGSLRIAPGESFTLTYSAAPSLTLFVQE